MAKKASTSSRRSAKPGPSGKQKPGKQKSIGKSKFAAKRLAKRTAAKTAASAKSSQPSRSTARPATKAGKPAAAPLAKQNRAPVRAAKKPTKASTAPIAKGTKLGKGVRVTPSAAAKGLSKASGPRARQAAAVQGLEATGSVASPQNVESTPPERVSQQNLLASATPPAVNASSDGSGKPKKQDAARARAFAIEAAQLIRDDKCEDVVVLDVRKRSSMTDFLVIGSGTSDRQMRSVLHHVEELGGKTGNPAVRTSVDERSTWILADFVDVMVHLFEPNTRSHYDLEMMWGDCDRVSWERPDQRSRDYAGLHS